MSSSEAGPSTIPSSSKEVELAIEPVHIYTDPNLLPPSSTSITTAFDRERQLADILPDGTNIFISRKPASQQLSEDVRRLWAERGDFSRFRTSDLDRKRPSSEEEESDDEEDQPKPQGEEEEEGILRNPCKGTVGGTIGESEFVKLRGKVLQNLDVAHLNSIHAHQLLGMLIKQYRSTNTASGSNNAAVAGRMRSPAPSVGAQSNRSGSTTTAAPNPTKTPLGIFGHLTHPSNREEEFILDPLSIALSRTSLNPSTAIQRDVYAEGEVEEEEDFDEDPNSAAYGLKQAKRELESTAGFKQNKLREFKIVLESKREAISNAAELLSSAGDELRESQGANRERWRALIGLHGRGWGLTPGRPLLDVERFGVSNTEEEEGSQGTKKGAGGKKKGAAGLQGFGTPVVTSDGKVKEEGARDAWIGFGSPEAPIELRRRSLAYWADTPASSAGSGGGGEGGGGGGLVEEVKQKLVFPDRMHRRLRVRFVLWPSTTTGGEGMEGKVQWSSDPPCAAAAEGEKKEGGIVMGQVLDSELQIASREASDELIFGDIVAQARLLSPSFGVRLTPTSVRIVLTKRLDLIVELVPTNPDTGDKEEEEEEEEEKKKKVNYSPHASLLLAFLRLGPLRKSMAFMSATKEGRKCDAPSRASALKANALAVPKKSTSAGNAKPDTGSGGGKGIAAGGKATSAALSKLDCLGPILVGLHYWSFVYRLGVVLRGVQERVQRERAIKLRIQLVPITPRTCLSPAARGTVEELTRSLARMVDGVPCTPPTSKASGGEGERSLHSIYRPSQSEREEVLKGSAKVYVEQGKGGQRLVCTLSFAQPSLLSIQFAGGKKTSGGVRLTNKPLSVDLDTLDQLLSRYIS
ncbi:uncharacterized protein UHOD_06966 [Ustilago sp. UG-2017b]|nr:uncharacterized protein UHOD_06966 [Ustilago sp. UG-2017b]